MLHFCLVLIIIKKYFVIFFFYPQLIANKEEINLIFYVTNHIITQPYSDEPFRGLLTDGGSKKAPLLKPVKHILQ